MMGILTERSFSEAKEERRLKRPARGTDLLNRAMVTAKVCKTHTAVRLGVSPSLVDKFESGGAQLGLHDLVDMAKSDPDFFAAILGELATLQGKTVIDRTSDATQADRLVSVANLAKETGELVCAAVKAAAANDPASDVILIAEGKDVLAVVGAEVAAAERRQARHLELVSRNAPRGARC